MRPRPRGFTLLEILVVFAVTAMLVAILFPVFNRVREKGRFSVCQSNLKQIALATQHYVQDNNGYYPARQSPQGNWNGLIEPYLQNETVFQCPSRQTQNPTGLGTAYSYNVFLSGIHESAIALPVHMDLNGEGGDSTQDGGQDTDMHDGPLDLPIWSPAMHSGGANRSYVDGHVKWYPKEYSHIAF